MIEQSISSLKLSILSKFRLQSNYIHSLDFAHHIQQFVIDDLDDFERFRRVDRIHEHVAVHVHRILGGKYRIFVLSRRVDEFQVVILISDAGGFREN